MTEEDIVQIVEPSKNVLDKADFYIRFIRKIIPNVTVTLIGSLAIPVCVKNEIDILVEIEKDQEVQDVQEKIRDESEGIFGVGPIENGEGYSRSKKKYGIICELHILHKGDARVENYLALVRRFQSDSGLAQKYDELKRSLDGVSSSAYKEAKDKFFREHDLKF